LAIPFTTIDGALGFVVAARRSRRRTAYCLELFDDGALAITASSSRTPWPAEAAAMVYLEDDAGNEDGLDDALAHWLELAEENGAITSDVRAYQGPGDLREARVMRHSVPATMNERGAAFRSAGGRKVSTDWAVPFELLGEALRESAAAIDRHGAPQPITYGHAGNGHPHQNFIGEDADALTRIHGAIEDTLKHVISMGGTVSAEHGLGKLKREWLTLQLQPRQIAMMRAMKTVLDPTGILSPGNIL
ncbi:MAG: FAD-linked oxidase C-terminal domain-containing protein, partial [Gemmatimonadaceae bacterium]